MIVGSGRSGAGAAGRVGSGLGGGGPGQKGAVAQVGGAPKGVGAQNFALFLPSPATMFALFSLPGGLLVEF